MHQFFTIIHQVLWFIFRLCRITLDSRNRGHQDQLFNIRYMLLNQRQHRSSGCHQGALHAAMGKHDPRPGLQAIQYHILKRILALPCLSWCGPPVRKTFITPEITVQTSFHGFLLPQLMGEPLVMGIKVLCHLKKYACLDKGLLLLCVRGNRPAGYPDVLGYLRNR